MGSAAQYFEVEAPVAEVYAYWARTGTSRSWPARGAGGSGARRGLGGKELCDDASVACSATALSSTRLR